MQYIVAAVLSFILQNMSNKEFSRRLPCQLHGLALFNAIALTCCAGALALAGGVGALSGGGWLLALTYAITFDVAVVLIVTSMSMGPMGATVLIINMSMLLPVTAGLVAWGEQLTLLKGAGIVCMLLVLVLSALSNGGDSKRGGVKWLILSISTMVVNGVLSIQQKLLSLYFPNDGVMEFSFATFMLAALICWAMVAVYRARGASFKPWTSRVAPLMLCAAGVGLGTAGGNVFQLLSLELLPAIVSFPLVQGSVVLSLWLLSILVYRDKVTLPGLLSLAAGIAGIIMLSV